jgi:uncharacterized protein (TIGR02466 family)
MTVLALFPTRVYAAKLQASGWQAFNTRLLRECAQYRADDVAGRAWSKERYPGGYTSYGSLNRMHTLSPTFATLARSCTGTCGPTPVRWSTTSRAAS